ncbi:MAG: Sec-independent protein translocase protein TatB [Gammaproteobacteria bacterium]|nr:Sec-independent protein translocase protein TatB [Gammaproteobacteria bacterium]
MSGIAGSELLLLCIIGLLILGPERLPRLARQIGSWVGKARQMTRAMQRQIEEELDVEKNLGINPEELDPRNLMTPRDDDTFSPLHVEEEDDTAPPPDDKDEKTA